MTQLKKYPVEIFGKTTLYILIPIVILVDIAAIMSLSHGLYPNSYAEITFLGLSVIFFIFAVVYLLRKESPPQEDNPSEEITKTKRREPRF